MEGPRAFAGKSRPQSLKSLKLANLKKGTPVIIHLSGHLKPFSGGEVEIVLNGEFTTVDEAFRALLTTHAALRDRVLTEIGDIRQNVNVFVGSNEVKRLKGLQTEMRGNEIHIFNAISGGYRRFKGKLVRPLESTFEIGGDRGLLSCSSLLRHEHR